MRIFTICRSKKPQSRQSEMASPLLRMTMEEEKPFASEVGQVVKLIKKVEASCKGMHDLIESWNNIIEDFKNKPEQLEQEQLTLLFSSKLKTEADRSYKEADGYFQRKEIQNLAATSLPKNWHESFFKLLCYEDRLAVAILPQELSQHARIYRDRIFGTLCLYDEILRPHSRTRSERLKRYQENRQAILHLIQTLTAAAIGSKSDSDVTITVVPATQELDSSKSLTSGIGPTP